MLFQYVGVFFSKLSALLWQKRIQYHDEFLIENDLQQEFPTRRKADNFNFAIGKYQLK